MNKFSNKKGMAAFEYFLIAAVFALTLGIAIFQMSPDLLRSYFENSVSGGVTTSTDGTLTIGVMGE